MKPKYLTQDDIKQYCISTVNASLDTIKKISSDTIFKVYIKIPIQNYTEKIYQNLDNIGQKTNCNVVISHINSILELREWFNSLSMDKYTSINGLPLTTTKVTNVSGIREYISQTLEMIIKVLQE